jgi:hypothetical protein
MVQKPIWEDVDRIACAPHRTEIFRRKALFARRKKLDLDWIFQNSF